jgi:hypothetical protein
MQHLGIDNGMEAALVAVKFPPLGVQPLVHGCRFGADAVWGAGSRVSVRPMTHAFAQDLDRVGLDALSVYASVPQHGLPVLTLACSISEALNTFFCVSTGDVIPVTVHDTTYWLEVLPARAMWRWS